MPAKKRKYEARFPPARIKKIMQTDEEIGKVAAAVPVIISRSLEIFLQSLVETTAKYTNERKAKTMTTAHLKHCIESEKKFDFLKDLVANIADVATQEEEDTGAGGENGEKPKRTRRPKQPAAEKKRKKKPSSSEEETESTSETEEKPESQTITSPLPPRMVPPLSNPSQPVSIKSTNSYSIESIMAGSSSSSIKSPSNIPPPFISSSFMQGAVPSMHPPVPSLSSHNQLQPSHSQLQPPHSQPQPPEMMFLPPQAPSMQAFSSLSQPHGNDDYDDDYDD